VRRPRQRPPEQLRLRQWVSVCEGALVFALLLFNPFELVSVRLCRDGGPPAKALMTVRELMGESSAEADVVDGRIAHLEYEIGQRTYHALAAPGWVFLE
jgi:hypothetical protein